MANQSSKEIKVDPATLSALWQRLIYVAEEQAKTLVRASFTSQSAEMQDIASAVFDSEGNMLAEGITGTVGVITALLRGLKHVVKEYPRGSLAAGDVLIGNDPWVWSGHTLDLAIVRPVFRQDRLIGFAATITHLSDIGGKGWANTVDIFEEGLRLPIMKLFHRGKLYEDLFRILRLNVRTPDDVEGDILAQLAATEVGAQRLLDLVTEYGLEDLEGIGQEIFARSEAVTREAIRSVPPGVYKNEVSVGGFEEPLKIAATITAGGDRLVVDYSGTSPQVARGINCVYNYTLAHTVFSIKCALCPDIPNNEGTYRPIVVQAPEGSILNAVPPAALVRRHVVNTHINRVLFGALTEAIPNQVIADCGGAGGTPANIKGVDGNGRRFISMMGDIRSMGASASRDGYSGVAFPSNMAIPSAEIIEYRIPVTILSRELVTDSGGPGKYRGGCAVRIRLRSESEMPAEIGSDQTWDFPAAGRLGGHSGNSLRRFINGSPAPADKVTLEVKRGDIVVGESASGGGFYPPEERDPVKVLEDVIDGYVSLDQSKEVYRVAIKQKTMEIDWGETNSLRRAEAK